MAGGATNLGDEDDGGAMISDINVTPLVDITLVLLIIFMVTARLIVNRAIPVKTPKAASGETVKTTLAIGLDAKGQTYLNGQPVSDRAKIASYVAEVAKSNPDIQAMVTADKGIEYGQVVELLDLVKQSGVSNVAMTVEHTAPRPPPTPSPAPPEGVPQ